MKALVNSGYHFFKRVDTHHIIMEHSYTGMLVIYCETDDSYRPAMDAVL